MRMNSKKPESPNIDILIAPRPPRWSPRPIAALTVLEAPALARFNWLVHGFSTRLGGASELITARGGQDTCEKVLHLGFTDWDKSERVRDNREKFFEAIGAGKMRVVAMRQIHSDVVHAVAHVVAHEVHAANQQPREAELSGTISSDAPPQGDALITREPGVLLVVQTADCVPILLADPKSRAIAAIHAGWRGTVRRIAAKALGRMQMEFGTNPKDVIAALGPGIGQSCYEGGSEVPADFRAQFPTA